MKNLLFSLAIAATLFLSSCGEEIARLPINTISTENNVHEESATLDLVSGEEIGIWSEMKMKYEGEASMYFYVKIFRDGQELTELQLDPREKNVSLNETKTEFNGKVNWKFSGKNSTYTVPQDGSYTFDAIFTASDNVNIEKAELILKK